MENVRNKKGFTLIEIIVVLVILAILAAVALVTYLGYVDYSKEKICESNRGSVKRFLMAHKLLGKDTSKKLQEAADSYDIYCPVTGKTYIAYLDTGEIIVLCDKHIEEGNFNLKDSLLNAIKNMTYNTRIDSTSAKGPNTEKVNAFLDKYTNVERKNIKSWAIINEGSVPILYWSKQDISGDDVNNKKVLVMRYNPNRETYTVGYMTVVNHTEDRNGDIDIYNRFESKWEEYTPEGGPQSDDDKKNFSKIKEYYDEAEKQGLIK